jgi:DNA/RNA endonuclease YhcR with UshA esterase domain
MKEKLILVIAFLASLAGIFTLFFLVENLDYGEQTIEKINEERISDMVKIEGDVIEVSDLGNITFISLMQPNYIDVVVFDEIELYSGERVEIIGMSEEYEGEMEIIAHRIRVIR